MKTDMELNEALDEIQYKYERLASLVGIMQQFTAECVEINGTPKNAVSNSLHEIGLEFQSANKELNDIIRQGWMVRKEAKK